MRDRAAALGSKAPKAPQLFEATIRGFGLDVGPDIERVLKGGAVALLPEDAFGGCTRVTTREAPRFELGYSLESSNGVRVLAKVDPAGPAYAAGLRDGMTYIRRVSGTPGNPAETWTLRVSQEGRERDVTYSPVGHGTVTLQQLDAPKDLSPEAREACITAVKGSGPRGGAQGALSRGL
jgi:predicted metalloprotease with PDZ domain